MALLGSPGSGKTTLLTLMAGQLGPSRRRLEVLGLRPHTSRPALSKRVYFVAPEQMRRHKSPTGASRIRRQQRIDTPARHLSCDDRMKVELLAKLTCTPDIAFLDEAPPGFDCEASLQLGHLLLRHNKATGSTLILSSSSIDELVRRWSCIVVLSKGMKILERTADELRRACTEARFVSIHLSHQVSLLQLFNIGQLVALGTGFAVLQLPKHAARGSRPRTGSFNQVVDLLYKRLTLYDLGSQIYIGEGRGDR